MLPTPDLIKIWLYYPPTPKKKKLLRGEKLAS